jgi:hypothetical protein
LSGCTDFRRLLLGGGNAAALRSGKYDGRMESSAQVVLDHLVKPLETEKESFGSKVTKAKSI